jgi:hypothetical protein
MSPVRSARRLLGTPSRIMAGEGDCRPHMRNSYDEVG